MLLSNLETFQTTLVPHSNCTVVASDVVSSMTSTLSTSIENEHFTQYEVFNRRARANPCPKYRQCQKSILQMIEALYILSTTCQNFRILPSFSIHHCIHIIGSSLFQGYNKLAHTCFVQACNRLVTTLLLSCINHGIETVERVTMLLPSY